MTDMEEKKIDDGQSEPVYGGCEGPNAMYVKLISSDDHEFIINRDYALTSGTIKAMLSGPGTYMYLWRYTYLPICITL
jgi:transcription elongation factor B subunit 1